MNRDEITVMNVMPHGGLPESPILVLHASVKIPCNEVTILVRANAVIRDDSHREFVLFLALSFFSLLMTLLFLYVEQDNSSEVPDAFGTLGIMTCWYSPRSMVRADNS